MIDLRGPCGHLYAQLDVEDGVIVKKCPQCSKAAGDGVAIFHCFDAATGRLLNGDIRRGPALQEGGSQEQGTTLIRYNDQGPHSLSKQG